MKKGEIVVLWRLSFVIFFFRGRILIWLKILGHEKNVTDFDIPIIQILRINITRINIKSHNFHAVCKNFQLSARRDDPRIVYGLPSR